MVQKLFPKQKRPSLPASDLIRIGAPELYYSVQQAFQNEGVDLIDLDTGEVIEGQVNVPDIGMIESDKPRKIRRQMGFVQSASFQDIEYEKRDLDAVLVLDESAQGQSDSLYLLIQVVDDDDLDIWTTIVIKVAKQFVTKIRGRLQPEVIFGITSLYRGNGEDDTARQTALRKIQRFDSDSVSVISYTELELDEDFFDEDDGGYEEESEV